MQYEVMFSWTKPNEHNRLGFISRFIKPDFNTYTDDIESVKNVFEKSVNIYFPILDKIKNVVSIMSNTINSLRRTMIRKNEYYDSG